MEPELVLLSPWIEPYSPDGVALELKRELAPDHPLYGKSVRSSGWKPTTTITLMTPALPL